MKKNENPFIILKNKVPELKNVNRIIFQKYLPIKTIGKSPQSAVFLGKCIKEKKYVAIKIQNKNSITSDLEHEAYYLYYLRGFGIPKIISYGISGNYKVLVETLLGKSIDVLLKKNNDPKSKMKDICMIAIQIMERIEYIHNKNIIHLDIKPANFLVGNPDDSVIYLIDYGISKKYRSSIKGKHIMLLKRNKFKGTLDYSSINSMRGYESSRRDDLISFGYMLIHLIKGELPWSNIKCGTTAEKYKNIFNLKKNTTNEELCKNLPSEFYDYIKYVNSLKFQEEPNYSYLKNLFIKVLDKMQETNDLCFSWRKIKLSKKEEQKQYTTKMCTLNGSRRKSPFINIIPTLEDKYRTINRLKFKAFKAV